MVVHSMDVQYRDSQKDATQFSRSIPYSPGTPSDPAKMLKAIVSSHINQQKLCITNQRRTFWEYVNMMFNKPDPERIKMLGPDRACAEWVLRNGGRVVWADGKKTVDYNSLPSEEKTVPKITEIDATDSGISHYGFPHLVGCSMLHKIILHNNSYIDDRALKGLSYGSGTLSHVQVSWCKNVTDLGLKEIKVLSKLETLVLFDLTSVDNLEECKQYLQTHLPKCKIEGALSTGFDDLCDICTYLPGSQLRGKKCM